jgi:hypothetical protein
VSISFELDEVEAAVQAARLAVDLLRFDAAVTEEDAEGVPCAVSGVLALVGCRLRDVSRVIRGSAPPRSIVAPHNLVDRNGTGEPEDLVLSLDDDRPITRKGRR